MSTAVAERLHVLVLAAGRGSRLAGLGEGRAKWLLPVGRRTIAERQVEGIGLARATLGDALAGATVVTGYAAQGVAGYAEAHGITPVHNERWSDLNNWYSVLLGLRALDVVAGDRVVVVNGDLCSRPAWLAAFLQAAATGPSDGLLAVDHDRPLTAESMKVATSPGPDGEALLSGIGKVGVTDPVGEYVGLLAAGGRTLEAFLGTLAGYCDDPARADEWYEGAVRDTAAAGLPWRLWATPDSGWVEIDDESDHVTAAGLLGAE